MKMMDVYDEAIINKISKNKEFRLASPHVK
jgi:hypothetical protein